MRIASRRARGTAKSWVPGETGADDHLGARLVVELGQQKFDVARIVLTVGVDLEQDVVSLGLGHPEPDPHGAADAQGERVGDHLRPRLPSQFARAVARAVVDHQDGGVRDGGLHLLHDDRDACPPR